MRAVGTLWWENVACAAETNGDQLWRSGFLVPQRRTTAAMEFNKICSLVRTFFCMRALQKA